MWVLITLEFSPMLYDNMGLLHMRIVGGSIESWSCKGDGGGDLGDGTAGEYSDADADADVDYGDGYNHGAGDGNRECDG